MTNLMQILSPQKLFQWMREEATDADFESQTAFKTAVCKLAGVADADIPTIELPPPVARMYWREGERRATRGNRPPRPMPRGNPHG